MKTQRNILLAFLLNLLFAVFEFVGGIITGSVAIASDALHDFGDALSIGVAYGMEKKSKAAPNSTYTYGYGRYSVLGGLFTTTILLAGSVVIIVHGLQRLWNPIPIHYDGMMVFAIVGVIVNSLAAFLTREKGSVNQKAVNLHMLEDVLGWLAVLAGAVVMRFTGWVFLDPILSIGVALFILIQGFQHMKQVLHPFLEKAPQDLCISHLQEHLLAIPGVLDVHHIHLWSIDGQNHCATMHIRTDQDPHRIKDLVRAELKAHGICHATLELETPQEHCELEICHPEPPTYTGCHHHHHHH